MLEFVRNMKIFGSEDLLWLLSYWSRDILPGNVRLIFGMSMVVIQTLITNFTLLCHVYVEGFDHQMWHMTGFQLLWIVTGASCMWGQETHTPEFFPERLISLTLGSSWLHLFIIYTSQNVSILRLRLWINDSGLFAWISLTALSQDLFYSWTGQKIRLGHLKNLVEMQGMKARWYSFMLERTQNRLVFHLNWPELTVRALFIIYRTSSIVMYLKFERNRTTTFGPIAFQRYYDTN